MQKEDERGKIFISYRRQDSSGWAAYLGDKLREHFGDERVFRDVDIPLGNPFPDVLISELNLSSVMLVLIGKDWAGPIDGNPPRIMQSDDWVCREVKAGLDANMLIIPVPVDGASIPEEKDLPPCIAELSSRTGLEVGQRGSGLYVDLIAERISEATGWSNLTRPTEPKVTLFGRRKKPVAGLVGQVPIRVEGNRPLILQGIGGVGKTQLAAKYLESQVFEAASYENGESQFDRVAWLDMQAETGATGYEKIVEFWVEQHRRAAQNNGIPVDSISEVEARDLISLDESQWLLIFDNAESPSQVRELIPRGSHVSVIITTRHQGDWDEIGRLQEIEVLPVVLAAKFLAEQANRTNDPDAIGLAERLGCLPLALALAAACCRENKRAFSAMMERLSAKEDLAGALNPIDPISYDRTITALWQESLDSVIRKFEEETAKEGRAGLVVEVARLLSLLDRSSVDRSWLTDHLPSGRVESIHDCLGLLNLYSLVDLTDNTVAIKHSLIAEGIVQNLSHKEEAQLLRIFLKDSMPPPSSDPEAIKIAGEPIRHYRHLLASRPESIPSEMADDLLRAARQLDEQGSALVDFHEALGAFCSERLREHDKRTVNAKFYLARCYALSGRFTDAIEEGRESVKAHRRAYGRKHHETLVARSALAAIYRAAGKTDKSIPIEEKVLKDRSRRFGDQHPETIAARANLASSYGETVENLAKAIALSEKVADDYEQIESDEHDRTLQAKSNLAHLYRRAGEVNRAIAVFEEVRDKLDGREPSQLTHTVDSNLAFAYSLVDRKEEALNLRLGVLSQLVAAANVDAEPEGSQKGDSVDPDTPNSRSELIRADRPDLLAAYADLAESYREVDRLQDAIEIQKLLVETRKRASPTNDSPLISISRINLADSYRANGQIAGALSLATQAVEELEESLGKDNPRALSAMYVLSGCKEADGQITEARALKQHVLERRAALLGDEFPDTEASRRDLVEFDRRNER